VQDTHAVLRRPTCFLAVTCIGIALSFCVASDAPLSRGSQAYENRVDLRCAQCHAQISDSYKETPMARASGPAHEGLIPGELRQRRTGIEYRIYEAEGGVWLSFSSPSDPEVRGKRRLRYYIGSGEKGRTYLFENDGYLFESPVNWYGEKQEWDMSPAYEHAIEAPLNLPAVASCLFCHTSGISPPAAGTENRYPEPPFEHAGITCERCHGDGSAHVRGSGAIVNPVKLGPAQRDAVCMQCHLEGDAAVEQAGRHFYEFRPGDSISDYVRYFVKADARGEGLRAGSQFEALWQSACKRKSGDAMSCESCHDPHVTPKAEERAAYFRTKCLACHGEKFAASRHGKQPDCVGCHLPPVQSADIAHTQATDHRIPRRAGTNLEDVQDGTFMQLKEFPPHKQEPAPLRDLALAWAALAKSGVSFAERQAERYLPKAVAQNPEDPALLLAYAYAEQRRGATMQARSLYEHALRLEPDQSEGESNLAVIEARAGDMAKAIALSRNAFQRTPWQSSIGLDLALLLCDEGQYDEARSVTLRVLQFNPDSGAGRQMMRALNADRPSGCRDLKMVRK